MAVGLHHTVVCLQAHLDKLTRTVYAYLHLFLAESCYVGYLTVGVAVKVTQVHTCTLLLRQLLHQLSHDVDAHVGLQFVMRVDGRWSDVLQ